MSEIVYYDANPSVRALMVHQFSQYGLDVITIPRLEMCEDVLKGCTHPVVLVADMSRQPEMLRTLQTVVPKYIHEAERCILTSVQPPALAPFLPENIDDCFFKHVVERPFKRLDFIDFFEEIIKPYLATSVSIRREHPVSSMNSSVQQITGPVFLEKVDEGLSHQVEVIVQSTSKSISLEQLKQDAENEEQPVQRNRMSRRSRAVNRDGQMHSSPAESALPSESSKPRVREQPRFTRENSSLNSVQEGSAPRVVHDPPSTHRDGSHPGAEQHARAMTPGRSRPSLSSMPSAKQDNNANKKAASETDLPQALSDDMAGSGHTQPTPQPNFAQPLNIKHIPANPYLKKADRPSDPTTPTQAPAPDVLQAIEQSYFPDDDDDESTLIVSPTLAQGIIEPCVSSPSLLIQTGESIMQSELEISFMKSLLKMSMIRQQRYTIVAKNRNDSLVIFVHNGHIDWIEKIIDSKIPDAEDFLATVPASEHLPIPSILNLLSRKMSLSEAFSSLGLEAQTLSLSQRFIQLNLQYLSSFEGRPAEVFHDIPARWLSLSQQRPFHDVDVASYLFEALRENSDSLIVPEFFQYTRFVVRFWRTPINVSITLNAEENELLKAIQTPATIADLRRTGRKSVAEILYRLVLFELADFAQ